ncbi:putative D-alanyl carrier protein [Calothrix parasitica NIES-267]|uniref:Putative D-alanyl carrier protein n=1 Tax=Calothrix parasitica NIES-267 TaxID=1973488 RepID=A0A1Z4LT42_9CYAN|nr:putative D-alanyl carrier protein [Calothrix parasitica NIES-267]
MQEIKNKIKQFISKSFRNYDLQDDENIFKLGFVNSMFAMQLVLFLEQEFEITIGNEDLDFENFNSIDNMIGFLKRKKTGLVSK